MMNSTDMFHSAMEKAGPLHLDRHIQAMQVKKRASQNIVNPATHQGVKLEQQLMNEPIEISDLADYINQINTITDSEKIYLYRGQENEEWQLNSSAYRRLNKEYDGPADLLRYLWQSYLKQIIDEIKLKYPSTYRVCPLECMAHLQHNKVATGLIDFTFSPLVALWFACADKNINGKIIVLENENAKIKEINTLEDLEKDLEEFFGENQEQWYRWAPTLDSRTVDTGRMTMQQSVFLFGLPEMDRKMIAKEVIIPAEHKEKVRVELAKMGISEKTLFADLLGFFERNTARHSYDLTLVTSNDGEKLS